ncbi:septum formation initiator family protein [Nordella sp. HKS 07]|uniref:FtsB family cell division protein n=1 Tax=Nordella sp. HKS 07 TaxID=2712222 RepID=UPI0013E1DA4B|nr:septum formation initiator family protein [Nordella sp. HKS 07]QIG51145.1 septum formation initiator family protein [Nordella sp. HKS 07]
MVKRKFDLIVMLVCMGLLGYFGWHGYYGPRSFDHRDALAAKAEALNVKVAAIRDERQALERKVSLMRPQSIDPDMLDELARSTLDFGKPGELIVKLPN